jgi:hypothetical protein
MSTNDATTQAVVEQARMAYLALRTGDWRDLRRALDHLTVYPAIPAGIVARLAMHDLAPQEANAALVAVRLHGDEVFGPTEDGLRRELTGALEQVLFGY